MTSYSEINTFDSCKMLYFFRYIMRMSGKDYTGSRALHVGTAYHRIVEEYENKDPKEPLDEWLEKIVGDQETRINKNYSLGHMKDYAPSSEVLGLDLLLAECMADFYINRILPSNTYTSVAHEYFFKEELGGETVIGAIDNIYAEIGDDGIVSFFPGDFKTWANSRSVTNLDQFLIDDMQTDIYLAVLQKMAQRGDLQNLLRGKEAFQDIDISSPVKVVEKSYTVLRKPPSHILKSGNFNSLKDQEKKIRTWYKKTRAAHKKARETSKHGEGTLAVVEEMIQRKASEINEFNESYGEQLSSFEKPDMYSFPCVVCDFFDVCRNGALPSTEFSYKRNRRK